nr:LysM peptidoglycan-binding domain-containing protein [Saprospiraceae bacterium]
MKSIQLLPIFCLAFLMQATLFANEGRQAIYSYIDQYKDIAIYEMERSGIPASIKMAQAILESNAGRSELALKANNHFGIKCHSDWNGKTHHRKDDDRDSRGRLIESCFRYYDHPEESYMAHSDFLAGAARAHRYGWLFELDPTDYEAWAHGLQKSGYATNRKYGQLLINLIENYGLAELDLKLEPLAHNPNVKKEASRNTSEPQGDNKFFKGDQARGPRGEFEINQLTVVKGRSGETLADIALELQLPLRVLLRFNDDIKDGFQSFEEDRPVFLQPKRRSFRGTKKQHRVSVGETMLDISLQYGLRLDRLYARNRMNEGKEPAVGEIIYLRGRRSRGEQIKYRDPRKDKIQEPSKTEAKEPAIESEDPISDPVVHQSLPGKDTVDGENDLPPAGPSDAGNSAIESVNDGKNEKLESPSKVEHQVQAGETLYAISRKYGISVGEITERNGLENHNLSIGQVLLIR